VGQAPHRRRSAGVADFAAAFSGNTPVSTPRHLVPAGTAGLKTPVQPRRLPLVNT